MKLISVSPPHVLTPSLLIKDYHYHQDCDDDNFDDYHKYDYVHMLMISAVAVRYMF